VSSDQQLSDARVPDYDASVREYRASRARFDARQTTLKAYAAKAPGLAVEARRESVRESSQPSESETQAEVPISE
jgi:hypothetical protein